MASLERLIKNHVSNERHILSVKVENDRIKRFVKNEYGIEIHDTIERSKGLYVEVFY